jgi:hypothetical protein
VAILIEESMRTWMAAHPDRRHQITEQGVARFFAALGPAVPPAPPQLERAVAAAREAVFAAVTADAVLDSLPHPPADAGAREALRGSWLSLTPLWTLPAPPLARGLPPARLALAAALGSLLAMVVLGTLLNWTLDLPALGLLLGGPLGAAGAMYSVGRLAESKTLRRTLTALVGVAGVAELVGTATLGFGMLWVRLAGFGLVRRVLLYAGLAALLAFTRDGGQYDAKAYREMVRDAVRQWVECASLLLCSLSLTAVVERPGTLLLDPGMARAVQDLHGSDLPGLPAAAEAVLLEARRLGLEGLDEAARFAAEGAPERRQLRWGPELAQHYRPFGLIELGDPVIVEDEPVIQNGVVLEKGRVRKQRS